MIAQERSDCLQMMLDVICHEIHRQRLSPEMAALVEEHIKTCRQCRDGVDDFEQVFLPKASQKNFG